MNGDRTGQVVVIFVSTRTAQDASGYAAAASEMEAAAAREPGYRGMESMRGEDGRGVTLSYWADEASAIAWRDDSRHRIIREAGRDRWYADYEVIVADVARAYAWHRP